jgi:hypothetical protein
MTGLDLKTIPCDALPAWHNVSGSNRLHHTARSSLTQMVCFGLAKALLAR